MQLDYLNPKGSKDNRSLYEVSFDVILSCFTTHELVGMSLVVSRPTKTISDLLLLVDDI